MRQEYQRLEEDQKTYLSRFYGQNITCPVTFTIILVVFALNVISRVIRSPMVETEATDSNTALFEHRRIRGTPNKNEKVLPYVDYLQ